MGVIGLCISVPFLFVKIKHFRANRGNIRIKLLKNTIDFFFSIGIFFLSALQLFGHRMIGVAQGSFTWYILGALAAYMIWAKINVNQFRKEMEQKTSKKSTKKAVKK